MTHLENPNEVYWAKFYSKADQPLNHPSPFAKFVLEYIEHSSGGSTHKLLDIGCGNARDSRFFAENGLKVVSVDSYASPMAGDFEFVHSDILDYPTHGFKFYYLRFVLHTLTEEQADSLLSKLSNESSDSLVFIETRSSKSITDEDRSETYFQSSIGDKHFRMLYSKSYLDKKLLEYFTIVDCAESSGFAVFGSEDPVCLRYILRPRSV